MTLPVQKLGQPLGGSYMLWVHITKSFSLHLFCSFLYLKVKKYSCAYISSVLIFYTYSTWFTYDFCKVRYTLWYILKPWIHFPMLSSTRTSVPGFTSFDTLHAQSSLLIHPRCVCLFLEAKGLNTSSRTRNNPETIQIVPATKRLTKPSIFCLPKIYYTALTSQAKSIQHTNALQKLMWSKGRNIMR